MIDDYAATPTTEEHIIDLCQRRGPEQRIFNLAGELTDRGIGQSERPRQPSGTAPGRHSGGPTSEISTTLPSSLSHPRRKRP